MSGPVMSMHRQRHLYLHAHTHVYAQTMHECSESDELFDVGKENTGGASNSFDNPFDNPFDNGLESAVRGLRALNLLRS